MTHMSSGVLATLITFGSVLLAATLGAFGWLVRQAFGELRSDIAAVGSVMTQVADKMTNFDRRVTRIEASLDLHLYGHPVGGRRATDYGNDDTTT